MSLHGRDVISIRDLSREEIEEILASARKMVPYAEGKKVMHPLEDKIVAMAFFEPSTRTRLSFESAVQRLGGSCITIADAGASSMRKGESLYDTIRMLSGYAEAIVIRHPNEGSARLAAAPPTDRWSMPGTEPVSIRRRPCSTSPRCKNRSIP